MTPTDLAGLCERLREQKIIDAFSTPLGPVKKMPTNPDGPEAAAAIERLVAALTLLDDAIWLNPDTGNFEINHDGSVEKARAIRTALEGASDDRASGYGCKGETFGQASANAAAVLFLTGVLSAMAFLFTVAPATI